MKNVPCIRPCNTFCEFCALESAQIWGRWPVSGIKGRIVMRKSSLTLLAAVIGLAASQASAADLPRKAPVYVPPAPPPITWTGCYIGANVRGALGRGDATFVFGEAYSKNNSGF